MSMPVVYWDHSEIRKGKLEALKDAIRELAAFVQANEPRLLAYQVYFSEDLTRMSVMHVHVDAASLDRHNEVVAPWIPRFSGFIKLLSIDLYGEPSERAIEQAKRKLHALGEGRVQLHRLHAGFARFLPEAMERISGGPAA